MKTVLGARPDHYQRLQLVEGSIEPWEDGLRTDPSEVSWEWWYFDCHLEDGSWLNIEFHTKPPYLSPATPLTPFVSLILERKDGTRITKMYTAPSEEFSASQKHCDVRIGRNTFVGDLHSYRISVEIEEIAAVIELVSEAPPWRPATGHVFFGEHEQHYVAWLPAVPRASVRATLTIDGRREALRGTGYHDHNWGNLALRKLIDHWYWGRARIDNYTVVTLMFFSNQAHGGKAISAFMVAKDGEILASAAGSEAVAFTAAEPAITERTGVPVANRLVFDFIGPHAQFTVTFLRHEDIFLLDLGKAGAYHRFAGDVSIERRESGLLVDRAAGKAMWELLYFGSRLSATASEPRATAEDSPILLHQA